MSVPYLPDEDMFTVGPICPQASGTIGVIGPGTGLGVGGLLPSGAQWLPWSGEGGHVTLPPLTGEGDAIFRELRTPFGHVSAERVLSGSGLVNLYQALCAIEGVPPQQLSPAD